MATITIAFLSSKNKRHRLGVRWVLSKPLSQQPLVCGRKKKGVAKWIKAK